MVIYIYIKNKNRIKCKIWFIHYHRVVTKLTPTEPTICIKLHECKVHIYEKPLDNEVQEASKKLTQQTKKITTPDS